MTRAFRLAGLPLLVATLASCIIAPAPAPYYGDGYGDAPDASGPPVDVGVGFGVDSHRHWR